MDPNHAVRIDACYRLLAACARTQAHPAMDVELTRQLAAFYAWDELPAQAELHSMAPLLRHHLKRINAKIPDGTKRTLDGLYLRHRAINVAHTEVLLEVNALFEKAGIRALVLKGLALAYEYYPEPALRPTSDIDILLQTTDIPRALELLKDSGFNTGTHQFPRDLIPKELKVNSPPKNGLITHIELHHHDWRNISKVDGCLDDEFSGFHSEPHPVMVGDDAIYVPAPLDTLNYLFKHLLRHMFVSTDEHPLPLRWIADIVSLVEYHAEMINWKAVFDQDPTLKHRLEVIYSLTPFPEQLAKFIPIEKITVPNGVNRYPQGWPQQVHSDWKRAGKWIYFTKILGSPKYIWDTLTIPSEWWLRLQYGVDEKSLFWHGQIGYRIQVIRMGIYKFLFIPHR